MLVSTTPSRVLNANKQDMRHLASIPLIACNFLMNRPNRTIFGMYMGIDNQVSISIKNHLHFYKMFENVGAI